MLAVLQRSVALISCGNAINQEYRARHHDELLARRRATDGPIRNGVYAQRRRDWARGT